MKYSSFVEEEFKGYFTKKNLLSHRKLIHLIGDRDGDNILPFFQGSAHTIPASAVPRSTQAFRVHSTSFPYPSIVRKTRVDDDDDDQCDQLLVPLVINTEGKRSKPGHNDAAADDDGDRLGRIGFPFLSSSTKRVYIILTRMATF